MIVNAGAHMHDVDRCEKVINDFVLHCDQQFGLNDGNDVILFRMLAPGHKNCGEPNLLPCNNFDEHVADVDLNDAKKVACNWNVFSLSNEHTKRAVENHNNAIKAVPATARMELLDAFPMTILRRDGHDGDEFCDPSTLATDCLHCSSPGPIDWQNHLLCSCLLDWIHPKPKIKPTTPSQCFLTHN